MFVCISPLAQRCLRQQKQNRSKNPKGNQNPLVNLGYQFHYSVGLTTILQLDQPKIKVIVLVRFMARQRIQVDDMPSYSLFQV